MDTQQAPGGEITPDPGSDYLITVQIEPRFEDKVDTDRLHRLAIDVLRAERVPGPLELGVVITPNEEVHTLTETLGPVGPDDAGYRELRGWLARFSDLYVHYGPVIRAWTEAEVEGDDAGRMGEELLAQVASTLIARIEEATPPGVDFDPQVAALAMIAMIERLHYYSLSRQLDVPREQLLDTMAAVLHVGVFGGSRRRRRRAAASA